MKTIKSHIKINQTFYKIIVINILVTTCTIKIMQAHERVIIRSIPEIVYIKENRTAQLINVKFYLENKTRYILRIKRLSLTVYNTENAIIFRKHFDLNESRTDWVESDTLQLLKGIPFYFENPFIRFNPDLELYKLELKFTFNNQNQVTIIEEIEIYPEYLNLNIKNSLNSESLQNIISNKSIHIILNKGIQLFSCLSYTNSK